MKRVAQNEVKVVGDIDVSGFVLPSRRLNIIVGSFGSGKTEISVNWAAALAHTGRRVKLADLDIANPYFRSREAQQFLLDQGVFPVVPHGEVQFSDLPVLVPQIKGMLQRADDDYSFFDVGGDETGARVLASLRTAIGDAPYTLFQVINERRPFTDSVVGCIDMKSRIETVSGLKVSAFINNTHLMEYTDENVVRAGLDLCQQLEAETGISVAFTTVMDGATDVTKLKKETIYPICVLKRRMLPPWLNHDAEHTWPLAVADRRG